MSGRKACPVMTCSETMPADQVMCLKCWGALPQYVRVSVDVTTRAVKNQPTGRNRHRLDEAVRNAVRIAATVSS